jgi:group I intron endonuclease
MAQGIYRITNLVNDKFYVGSTNNSKVRFRNHQRLLKKGTHHCKHLQAAWSHYGGDKFRFAMTELVELAADLERLEDVQLQLHVGKDYCYNSGYSAKAPWRGAPKGSHPSFGVPLSAEQKQAIGDTLRAGYASGDYPHPRLGKAHTPETRAKIVANRTAPAGENHYRHGQTLSAEVRQKIGDTQRGVPKGPGRKVSEAGRAKIAAAAAAGSYSHWEGRQHTEEAKAKMSRSIIATNPAGLEFTYPSITKLREVLELKPPTVNRALKAGKPLAAGPRAGWSFRYAA